MKGHVIKKGDKITALGYTFTVEKVLYCEWYARDGYDVEFIDPDGHYHHWKQWEDGGKVEGQPKRLIDWYGQDVTDLFIKYGYKI